MPPVRAQVDVAVFNLHLNLLARTVARAAAAAQGQPTPWHCREWAAPQLVSEERLYAPVPPEARQPRVDPAKLLAGD